jgi:hypothetical protein
VIIDCGCDEIVRNSDLLVLDIKDALVGFRPHPVQALNSLLSFKPRAHAVGLEVIARVWRHHFRREYLLIAPCNFQIAASGIAWSRKRCLGFSVTVSKLSIATFNFVTSYLAMNTSSVFCGESIIRRLARDDDVLSAFGRRCLFARAAEAPAIIPAEASSMLPERLTATWASR